MPTDFITQLRQSDLEWYSPTEPAESERSVPTDSPYWTDSSPDAPGGNIGGGLIFPRNAKDVQKVIYLAREARQPLVPSGGRTGLSGGAYCPPGAWVVSFDKMNRILELDQKSGVLTVEPGVTLARVQEEARRAGWFFPVDYAARGSCQAGGMVATNGGGKRAVRFGTVRHQLRAFEVITGRGETLEIERGRLLKDNRGFPLFDLFPGSEGTLGLFTKLAFQLVLPPRPGTLYVVAAPALTPVTDLYETWFGPAGPLRPALLSFEVLDPASLEISRVYREQIQGGSTRPVPPDHWLALIELEELPAGSGASPVGATGSITTLDEEFQTSLINGDFGVIWPVENEGEKKVWWEVRETVPEALAHRRDQTSGLALEKFDISIGRGDWPHFYTRLKDEAKPFPGLKVYGFGHLGDGNLHINCLLPAGAEQAGPARLWEKQVFTLVEEFQGSVSAEHGLGRFKSERYLTPEILAGPEWQLRRAIKEHLDPKGILNPGVYFP